VLAVNPLLIDGDGDEDDDNDDDNNNNNRNKSTAATSTTKNSSSSKRSVNDIDPIFGLQFPCMRIVKNTVYGDRS
jgi:hypothetical protein